MHWEPLDRLGFSLRRTGRRARVEFDRHGLRPNNLWQVTLFGLTLSLFWPRARRSS